MSGACCPPGSWTAAAPPAGYENKGKIERLNDQVDVYVVRPPSGNKSSRALIVCPDIFGLDSGRSKLICDDFAEKLDVLVLLVDVIEGDPWPIEWGMPTKPFYNLFWFVPWCVRHNSNKTLALFQDHVKPFLDAEGITSFAVASFCYGAIPAEAFSTLPGAKGHVGFHPSHKIYDLAFGPSLKTALSNVKCPQLWLVGVNDPIRPGDANELIVREGAKQSIEIKVFEDQVHGWVNRGDVSKPEIQADVEKALNLACEFFKTHLV